MSDLGASAGFRVWEGYVWAAYTVNCPHFGQKGGKIVEWEAGPDKGGQLRPPRIREIAGV